MIRILIMVLTLLWSGSAPAEQQDFGPWEVHYSVFNSTFLLPEVARRYQITRGKDRILMNVSVRRKNDDGSTVEHRATVRGNTSDLIRTTPLEFREIVEQDAVYYLATFRVLREETLRFRLQVQPETSAQTHMIEFTKTVYQDE